MRRLVVFLILISVSPCMAELERLLEFQRAGDSGAFVSSGFHDWRTVSKYRSRAGIHGGYDIAMLAGSEVRAAWSGQVTAVTPWYGSEYGVTVRSSSGHEATYGHISPLVRVGQAVQSGQVLGTVVVDHVDVKIRDRSGYLVDFRDLRLETTAIVASKKPVDPELKERYRSLKKDWLQHSRLLEAGLASPNKVQQLRAELDGLKDLVAEAEAEVEEVELEVETLRPRTDALILSP